MATQTDSGETQNIKMKKLLRKLNEVHSDSYGDTTLTSQGQTKSRFTKTGRPPGIWEDESISFKVVNTDTGKTIDFGLDQTKAEEIVAAAKEENINAEVVKMKNIDDVGKLNENALLDRGKQVYQAIIKADKKRSLSYNDTNYYKNIFKTLTGIPFSDIDLNNSKHAAELNKFAIDLDRKNIKLENKMKSIKEAGIAFELEPSTGGDKELKIFKNKSEADKFVQQATNIKKATQMEENLAGVVAIGQKAMKEALATSNYRTVEDVTTVFEELKRGAYYVLEDLYNDFAPNAGAAPDEMMEAYMKERGDSNLMEHMDKHRKRSTLMEGAMKRFFKAFDGGKTDEELVHEYALEGITVPEAFVSKARRQWEGLKKAKLDLELSEKEAKGFKKVQTADPTDIAGMEPIGEKHLASGLFN